MARRPDAPAAPATRLKTAGHVAVAATEFEKGAALPLKEACRALFTASRSSCRTTYWTTCEAWVLIRSLVKTCLSYRHHDDAYSSVQLPCGP